MSAQLLRDIREEVIGLLFNRYVFRTHQEVVRFNPRLQGRPHSIFSEWAQVVYALANVVGVRRLASASYQDGDVNLVRLLDMLIQDPGRLWGCFGRCYPDDAARARGRVLEETGELAPGWENLACKRLLGEDRKRVITAAETSNQFASKRVAHSVPEVEVRATFSQLDEAIGMLKELAEKRTLLACSEMREQLEPAHRAGAPTVYPLLARMENRDLLEEMKGRKLPEGWDSIFLEPWATPETIARSLGEMLPPTRSAAR